MAQVIYWNLRVAVRAFQALTRLYAKYSVNPCIWKPTKQKPYQNTPYGKP